MDQKQFLEKMRDGKRVTGRSEEHRMMHELAEEAMRLTSELNGSYHSPEEIRNLMSQITGRPVDETKLTKLSGCFRRFIRTAGKIYLSERMCLSTAAVIFRIREAFIWEIMYW